MFVISFMDITINWNLEKNAAINYTGFLAFYVMNTIII